ncbi:MAG: hypothetical protein RLZZ142_1279 [Verrucomicrobiota bacterium]
MAGMFRNLPDFADFPGTGPLSEAASPLCAVFEVHPTRGESVRLHHRALKTLDSRARSARREGPLRGCPRPMPNYDYHCEKCNKSFEVFQSMKDDPLKTCPKEKCCMKTWGKGKVRRQIGTGAGLIFKGSGFYITDYRSENYKSAAKSDSSSASTASSAAPSSPAPAATPSGSASGKAKKSE